MVRARVLGGILAALAVAAPGAALANQAPVVDSVQASSLTVERSSIVTVTCLAHDDDGSATLASYAWSASGGSFPNGAATYDAAAPAGETTFWTAPAAFGAFILQCRVQDDGGGGAPLASPPGAVTVEVVSGPTGPRVDAIVSSRTDVLVGEIVQLSASVSDPDDTTLAIAWTATGGLIAGDRDADPGVIAWTPPPRAGRYAISVVVEDPDGNTASATTEIVVRLARSHGAASRGLLGPGRLAARGLDVVVADLRRRELRAYSPVLQHKLSVKVPGEPIAVAADDRGFVVGLRGRRTLATFDRFGRPGGDFAAGREFVAVADVQSDPDTGAFFVSDRGAGQVLLIDRDGDELLRVSQCGAGSALRAPVAAARAGQGNILVVQHALVGRSQICVYRDDGTFVRTYAPFGSGTGKVTQGVDVAGWLDGRVIVVDTFQGEVRVFDAAGADMGTVGTFGRGPGEVIRPLGVTLDAWGQMYVSSFETGRVERFAGPDAQTPFMPGDADFDGLPDAWERSAGLDPEDPIDYAADPDGDMLTNTEELERGTLPRVADTDGDGWNDGREVTAGTDPTDPRDHGPAAHAGAPQRVPPSLVHLDATASHDPDGDPITFSWRQLEGPAVKIEAALSAQPAVEVRSIGRYVFGVSVSDGFTHDESTTEVAVYNVPPQADVGAAVTSATEEAVTLRGGLSGDGNRDALAFRWIQLEGATVAVDAWDRPSLRLATDTSGYRAFSLTVDDGELMNDAPVDVVLSSAGRHVPRAAFEIHGVPRVGEPIELTGESSADLDGDALAYLWEVREGEVSVFAGATDAAAHVVPAAAGRLVVALTVTDATGLESPPLVREIMVGAVGDEVPVAVIDAPDAAVVRETVRLDGEASFDPEGATLTFVWRQVEGPYVFLTTPVAASTTVAPLSPGAYVFELAVRDGNIESAPARHTLIVSDAAGGGAPTAVAAVSHLGAAGEWTELDGAGSRDPDGDRLYFQWTQVRGPFVPLFGSFEPYARFMTNVPGTYGFALHVDDGALRGPAALVEVVVAETALVEADSPEVMGVSGGCQAAGCAASGSGWAVALAVAMVLRWRRRGSLVLVLALLAARIAAAADAPHDLATNNLDCMTCHTGHNAAGAALTSQEGITNLCLSCHNVARPTVPAFKATDQAHPLRGGFHHRWDSGVSGFAEQTVATNLSTGSMSSGGDYTGTVTRTYTLTITVSGTASTARLDWSATGGGSGANVDCGVDRPLADGVTFTCTNPANGAVSTNPSCLTTFCAGDAWAIYVSDAASAPSGPSASELTGGSSNIRMPGGKITCAACHNAHSQANAAATTNPAQPTWNHFMRIANDAGQLCRECHASRFPTVTWTELTRTWTGTARSHPVGMGLDASGAGYDFAVPRDANGASQATGDGIASNDLVLDGGGRVTCLSCHGMHFTAADDNAQTP
ncbi:MAG: PKD domain-containing protein [Deltaproteobacteria bacterium]|nr:PKD domain-containing protein [Deltaproteobacteria bacterium]